MATADRPGWRTSSFTDNGSSCVEVDPGATWRTSSFSGNGESCVEVEPGLVAIRVRDTKDHGLGTVLLLDGRAFDALCRAAADRAAGSSENLTVTHGERRTEHAGIAVVTTWHVGFGGEELHFTDAEWDAFAAGVRAREFAFSLV